MHPFFKPKRALTASPEATPYQRAGQVWDDRMGLSIAHARNWRRIALANLALAAFLGAGWWVQADRAVVRPFVVEVSDSGIGIPGVDLERIFERFYRVDRSRGRDTGGTGLGLAIVRHVTQNHGGSVEVTSTEGVGTTFTVRLPAVRAERP